MCPLPTNGCRKLRACAPYVLGSLLVRLYVCMYGRPLEYQHEAYLLRTKEGYPFSSATEIPTQVFEYPVGS